MNNISLVKVALTDDIQENRMMGIENDGKEVLIAKLDGKFYAIGNECAHRECKLSNGTLIGDSVECPCHGSVFDIKTGKVVKGPAKKPEPVFKAEKNGDSIIVNVW